MASDHIMDALMLFYTHSSSLAVSLDCIWISQRKVLPWRMSTRLMPCVRLVVVQKKKKKYVCLSSYTFHEYQTIILETSLIPQIFLQTLREIYVFLCMITTTTSSRYGQESLIAYFMASVFSNSLRWTRISKLRVLDWITYTIAKQILGPTSTKDWLIACILVMEDQKLLESGR